MTALLQREYGSDLCQFQIHMYTADYLNGDNSIKLRVSIVNI